MAKRTKKVTKKAAPDKRKPLVTKPLNSKEKALLAEMARRKRDKIDVFTDALDQQKTFCLDPSRLKAILATRRASKSFTAGLYLFDEAIKHPGTSSIYIALTRDSAKKIMVKDVLKVINKKYNIKAKFNEVSLTFTLPNGSVIYLMGMDANADEKEKALGQKFRLAVIDEAASFKQDLREIVYGVLQPAMADLDGTIIMIGTPGNNTRSLFYDVTTGKEKGWSVYNWKALDNKYVADSVRKDIEKLIENNPLVVETPIYKQMYLGQWVIELDKLVYRYNPEKNLIRSLPGLKGKASWNYVLGIDLGYEDASAFVVCAYNEYDQNLYIVDVFSKSKMDITDVANKIKEFQKKYDITKFIVDGASKQAVEEIKARHLIPLEAAEKTGKADYIEIMNSELIMGRIKLLDSIADPLTDEWLTLIWDEKSNRKVEHSACPNHLADAALYAWRHCYNYASDKFTEKAPLSSEQAIDEWEEKAEKEYEMSSNQNWWER